MRSPNIDVSPEQWAGSTDHRILIHAERDRQIDEKRNQEEYSKRRYAATNDEGGVEYGARGEWRKFSFLLFILLYNVYAYASMGNEGKIHHSEWIHSSSFVHVIEKKKIDGRMWFAKYNNNNSHNFLSRVSVSVCLCAYVCEWVAAGAPLVRPVRRQLLMFFYNF